MVQFYLTVTVNGDGEPLDKATFGLFKPNETTFNRNTAIITAVTDEDGGFYFGNVPYGKWLIREIEPPTGYVLNNTAYVIEQAREMDLLTFLQIYEPTELVQISSGVYSTKTHNSLKISNGKWCWWSRGIGGRSALDYLIKVKDVPFMEAVEIITGRAVVSFSERKQPSFPMPKEKPAPNPKNLVLPKVGRCAAGVFNYLSCLPT